MKVFCKGFNLYKQLTNDSSPLVNEFTEFCSDTDYKNIYFNHTYTLVKNGNILKFCSSILEELYELTEIDLSKMIADVKTLKISCDDEKILILSDTGQLYKLFLNNHEKVHSVPKFWNEGDKVDNILSSPKLNVALCSNGNLYNIPNQIETKHIKDIIDIKIGREHCIILTKNGDVYSFGRGSRGQLGHGSLDDISEPHLVEALSGIKIIKIAAGGWHSCAVSSSGDLYTWGWNNNGQLGLGNDISAAVMGTPHVVTIENCDKNVIEIACGYRHTIALLDDGDLYGCGWNKYKQIKNENCENIQIFVKICDFSNEDVVEIICGPWSSSVVCK